jgi:hypothetical protein
MKLGPPIAWTSWRGGAGRPGVTLAGVALAGVTKAAGPAEAAELDAISVTEHARGSAFAGGVAASQVEARTTLGFISRPSDAR